ncbi:MAG: GspMb/PilO family protein [Planctomycetota bacterium]
MSTNPNKTRRLLLYGAPLALGAAALVGLGVYRWGLSERVASLESELKVLRGLPSDVDKGRLLEAISRELTARDVTEIQTQGQPGAAGTDFSRFTFGLTFQAPFEKVYEIVEAIEAKDQIIRVDLMEIRGRVRQADGRVGVHMKLSAFASSSKEEVAS